MNLRSAQFICLFRDIGYGLNVNLLTISAIAKCYCEFKDKGADNNGIMCDTTDGSSRYFGSCDVGKPCTGDETEDYVNRKSKLCENSKKHFCMKMINVFKLIYLFPFYLILIKFEYLNLGGSNNSYQQEGESCGMGVVQNRGQCRKDLECVFGAMELVGTCQVKSSYNNISVIQLCFS